MRPSIRVLLYQGASYQGNRGLSMEDDAWTAADALCHPGVVVCLSEYMSIGLIFRIRIALGRRATGWPEEVRLMVCERLGLCPKHKWSALHRKMASRCVECGERTRCNPRVCTTCVLDYTHPYAMLTRSDIRDRWKGKRKGLDRIIQRELSPVKRTRTGAFMYWLRRVEEVMNP